MQATKRYQEALDNMEKFVQRHRTLLEEYLKELGLAEQYNKPGSNAPDDQEGAIIGEIMWADYEKEAIKRMDAVRMSERFKHVVDMRDQLLMELRKARAESMTKEDHPLYTDRARKKPKDQWLIELDEKNYDRFTARTAAEKMEVERNLRHLFDAEQWQKDRDAKRAEYIARLRKDQRDRGIDIDPNQRIRPIEE